MQVAKWGNSLAVRLPKDVVDALELKVGDAVNLRANAERTLEISRVMTRAEAIDGLRKFQGRMPTDFKFDRDEANAR